MKTKKLLLGLSALLVSSLAFFSCSDDEKEIVSSGKTTPKLGAVTVNESSITHNAAMVTAELIDWGEAASNSAGICWASTPNPSVNQQTKVKIDMSDPGSYEYTIKNLLPETKYYVRSFARNERGLIYSEQLEFETKAESPEMMDYVEVGNLELIGEPGKVNADLKSAIISNGGGTLKRAGFVVSENPQPTVMIRCMNCLQPRLAILNFPFLRFFPVLLIMYARLVKMRKVLFTVVKKYLLLHKKLICH